MSNSNNTEFPGLRSPFSLDDSIHIPLGDLSDPNINPLDHLLPDPLRSGIPDLPSSQTTNTSASPTLTEEDERHIDNLLNYGIDSPVLPTHVALALRAKTSPDLASALSQYLSTPTTSNGSPSPVSSALFSPATAYAAPSVSPPTQKRRFSLVEDTPQDPIPTPGPSTPMAPRPAKRQCTATSSSYPGESSFQLDPTVAPLQPSQPTNQPIGRPRVPRTDYSACRCPGGLTSKPARHWRVCRYNPESGAKPFTCEICGINFGREDNKKRHIEDYH